MKKHYFLVLFSLYSIISFGQFDVSEMEFSQSNTSNQYQFSSYSFRSGTLFNSDGTKIYLVSDESNTIQQFDLSTPFDISSINESTIKSLTTTNRPYSLNFNSNGTELFFLAFTHTYEIIKYDLNTAFDISSATYAGNTENFETNLLSNSFKFNNNGTKLFVAQIPDVYEFSLSTPYKVSSAISLGESEKINTYNDNNIFNGFTFSNDGTKLFFLIQDPNTNINSISEYTLSIPFDLSTAFYTGNNQKLFLTNTPKAGYISFDNNGNKLFLLDSTTETIYTYTNGSGSTTLSSNLSNQEETKTIDLQDRKFTSSTNSVISVFNIVGQQIENNNLKSGVYIIILRSTDGTVLSFKRAI